MRKLTKEITFNGINKQIRQVINEKLGMPEVMHKHFLNNFCTNNDINIFLKSGFNHEIDCEVGYDDDATSENICDALLELFERGEIDDDEIYAEITVELETGNSFYSVGKLNLREYTELTIVDKYGIEVDISEKDFSDCVFYAINNSLNNNSLQSTKIYKSIFGTEDTENMDDEEYNEKFNRLVEEVLKSVKKYMLSESGNTFNYSQSQHFSSGYFFLNIPEKTDPYTEDICDVMYCEDK